MTVLELAQKKMENIKKDWFANHKATVEDHNGIFVVNWMKPGTNVYGVRYIFDRHYLFISGDLGEAVFNFTWNAKPTDFNAIDLVYLHSKLSAIKGKEYDFYADIAISTLREYWDFPVGFSKYKKEIFEELCDAAYNSTSKHEWEYYLSSIDWQKIDPDAFEWISNCGDVYASCFLGYVVGLQMISEQLA